MKSIQLIFSIFISNFLGAQSDYWKHIDNEQIELGMRSTTDPLPRSFSSFELNAVAIKNRLLQAPHEDHISSFTKVNFEIELPDANGNIVPFVVWESPIMEDEIASRYPNIKSYKGYNKNHPSIHLRMTMHTGGLYAATIENGNMSFIDPVQNQSDKYIAYNIKNYIDPHSNNTLKCGTDDRLMHEIWKDISKGGSHSRKLGDKIEMRKYRFALACAGEWGQIRGTKEKALEEMNAFVDRANLVFEDEVGLRLVLINQNDQLIYLNPLSDPYFNPTSGGNTVGGHSAILNNIIGANSYDVGHVFLPCQDVGGVAAGIICSSSKGNGVTCYNGQGVNPGTVLVFNHEVAHQMTAGHTWNHCEGNEGQLAAGTAFEPGSGSTIMSYAWACGPDNLGINREGYYHSGTLEQILEYTNVENSNAYICAEKTDFDNYLPEISIVTPENVVIPKSTPFYLYGKAQDKNNDPMTYIWEQIDADVSAPLGQPVGNCPLFRSYRSTTAGGIRLFPNKDKIFNKEFNDPTETLPTYTRDMNFRFAVRDNNPQVNGVSMKDVKFKVSATAGPFAITQPSVSTKLKAGKSYVVKWDVANTNQAPINAQFVDILIGYGNSLDFSSNNVVMIAERIPNTGEALIKLPSKETTSARIIIRGNGNIFFTVSPSCPIEAPDQPGHYASVAEIQKAVCLPTPVSFEINTFAIKDLMDSIRFEVISGLPQGAIPIFEKPQGVKPGESNLLTFNLDQVSGTADYLVLFRTFVPGLDTVERYLHLNLTGTDLDSVQLKTPIANAVGLPQTQRYEWEQKVDATSYLLQVATSPAFNPSDIVLEKTTTGLIFLSEVYLEKAQVYYWRVRSSNSCGDGEWSEINAFSTSLLKCQKVQTSNLALQISSAGPQVVEGELYVLQEGTIKDVNISNINITHTQSGDLTAYLISPKGTKVKLWSNRCGTSQNVNVGLDDESNFFFSCPINTGRIYRPEEKLNAFVEENMEGKWLLRVEDNKAGGNGRFNTFALELCADVALEPPVLVNNDTLEIHPKDKRIITPSLLLSQDNTSPSDKVNFTLVELPLKGKLILGGTPLTVGSKFTQAQINASSLTYVHTADDESLDNFSFIVDDSDGGYLLKTKFVINVNSSFPSSSKDETKFESHILVYPNPGQDIINIDILSKKLKMQKISISDMKGINHLVIEPINDHPQLDVSNLLPGVYIITLQAKGERPIVRKWTKI
jgi:subtilisin-like proprotein convertase family protein